MVDYSKWDLIEDDDVPEPGEGLPTKELPKHGQPAYVDRKAHHDESMQLIASWTKEAYPRQTEDELQLLMRFISVQHKGIHPNNIMRHREIVAFLKSCEKKGKKPELHALLGLAKLAQKRLSDSDENIKGQAGRILMVSMSAINTLVAADSEGGAAALFETCLKAPLGEVCRKYVDLRYATEIFGVNAPKDPRDIAEEEASDLWWSELFQSLKSPKTMAILGTVLVGIYSAVLMLPDGFAERIQAMLPDLPEPPEDGMGGMGGMQALPPTPAPTPPPPRTGSGLGVPDDVMAAAAAAGSGSFDAQEGWSEMATAA